MVKHDIVFEDLTGSVDPESVSVDLGIEDASKGITRLPADEPKPAPKDPDGDEIDDLDKPQERAALGQDDETVKPDEDGDEDGHYSERVRKRIQRERRRAQKAVEDRDYWKAQAEEATKASQSVAKAATEQTVAAMEAQISTVETELAAAIEAGRTGEQVKLMSKLTDLKAERLLAKQSSSTAQVAGSHETGTVKPSGRETLAAKWIRERSDWFEQKGFERHTLLAKRIDKQLYGEGYDVNDPEYFEELDRRLKEKAPELYDDTTGGDGSRGRRSGQPSVLPVRGGIDSGGRSRNADKVEVTPADYETMRKFGLDPRDPEHLREFARNKREAEADERRRQGGRS